jgi:hypothetical protein
LLRWYELIFVADSTCLKPFAAIGTDDVNHCPGDQLRERILILETIGWGRIAGGGK